ncbi:hypothetical protein [Halospeciosus flavus]|uniref:Uncharacterized protein n=1 Tax=Halospeciosus flavus TaxID=3032283 RepID=A0ABD5Z206_9EURY|nr:hypothetical protein [Halospeciosus flavus]
MRLKLTAIALVLVAVSAVVGASAFTTATLDRDANVDVVTDQAGIVGLTAGINSGIISPNSDGALTIDFAQNNVSGANVNATFELGENSTTADFANGTSPYAFKLTNQDTVDHSFVLDYAPDSDNDNIASVKFEVYSDTPTANPVHEGTVDDETATSSGFTVAPGKSLYVVILNTNGLVAGTDDLSGTLKSRSNRPLTTRLCSVPSDSVSSS